MALSGLFIIIYASVARNASANASEAGFIQVIYAQPTPAAVAAIVAPPVAFSSGSSDTANAAPASAPLANVQPRRELVSSPLRSSGRSDARVKPTLALVQPSPTPATITSVRTLYSQTQIAEAPVLPLTSTPCARPVGQIVTETLDSNVTAVPITVHVYLPPCYNPQEYSYPTLYLIHGTAFEQGGWLYDGVPRVADVQMSIGALPPFIVVMPGADMRAGDASKYSWTNSGKGSYEDFFVNELVPFIDQKYSTWASRDGRAIGGISRGGYWSIEIGFANPDMFSAVGGHSPSVFTKLVDMPANFSMLDMAKSVDALNSLRIWLDAGSDDWARVDMNKLAGDLDQAGVAYQADIGAGGHEDSYWTSRVPDYLAFYSSAWPRVARSKQVLGSAVNP